MCSIPTCRLSPKAGRKDRGRQLRSKRERASSPSAREAPLMRARSSSASLILDRAREPVKQVGTKHEVEYFPHCAVVSRLVNGTFIAVGSFPSSMFSSALYISRGYEYELLVNKRKWSQKRLLLVNCVASCSEAVCLTGWVHEGSVTILWLLILIALWVLTQPLLLNLLTLIPYQATLFVQCLVNSLIRFPATPFVHYLINSLIPGPATPFVLCLVNSLIPCLAALFFLVFC